MKKTKKVIKKIPKKVVAFVMLIAMIFSYIAPLTNVLAVTTYGEGEKFITANLDNQLGFTIISKTINGEVWNNDEEDTHNAAKTIVDSFKWKESEDQNTFDVEEVSESDDAEEEDITPIEIVESAATVDNTENVSEEVEPVDVKDDIDYVGNEETEAPENPEDEDTPEREGAVLRPGRKRLYPCGDGRGEPGRGMPGGVAQRFHERIRLVHGGDGGRGLQGPGHCL